MPRPLILFAHGAGAGSAHPWMRAWIDRLGALGHVHAFDYPYMAAGRRAPDRLPKLIEAHREQLAAARAGHDGPVLLAGKSMGSRVGCHLSLEEPVDALICFGFPLHPARRPEKLRNEVLEALRTPVLFVQGTRDPLCELPLLAEVRERMTAPNELHVVEEGDHSLQVTARWRKATGRSQEDVHAEVLEAVRGFLSRW